MEVLLMLILIFIVTAPLLGLLIALIIHLIDEKNDRERQIQRSPRVTIQASVISKRTHTEGYRYFRTHYFVTFQFPHGNRREFEVPAEWYGHLLENDRGTLIFQSIRFLGFQRRISPPPDQAASRALRSGDDSPHSNDLTDATADHSDFLQ